MKTRTEFGAGMRADMLEQPRVLRRLIERRAGLQALAALVVPHPLTHVAFVARGSSANAALYGRLLFETTANVSSTLVAPSMQRLYGRRAGGHASHLAIGISQSGRTEDVTHTLAALGRAGATTIALTAHVDSPLSRAADATIDIQARDERAVPATKTFLAEAASLTLLVEAIASSPWSDAQWDATARAVTMMLADDQPARDAARALHGVQFVSIIGAGLMVPFALEAALKLEEAARIPASGTSTTEFRHGPMVIAGDRHAVVAIAYGTRGRRELAAVRSALNDVPILVIGDGADVALRVPEGLPEPLAALAVAVRMQQLALEAALARGVDPDRPPRLEKVTPT